MLAMLVTVVEGVGYIAKLVFGINAGFVSKGHYAVRRCLSNTCVICSAHALGQHALGVQGIFISSRILYRSALSATKKREALRKKPSLHPAVHRPLSPSQVLLAIDDSRSMAETRCGPLALEAMATICRAMSTVEVGEVGVAAFGEKGNCRMLHHLDKPFTSEAAVEVSSGPWRHVSAVRCI